jgi:homoserine dehydrogenase
MQKIAILSSIAFNEYVDYRKIPTEGITKITTADLDFVGTMDSVIKLIATSKRVGDKIYARVSPAVVRKDHPLSNVFDVFNAIVVKGNAIGDAMFYGRGAGKLPTASAVVADIIDIVKHNENNGISVWNVKEEDNMVDPGKVESGYYVRIKVRKKEEAQILVREVFGKVDWLSCGSSDEEEAAFITGKISEESLKLSVERLKDTASIKEVANALVVLDK